MKNDSSRFSFETPGFFRSVFYVIRYRKDWNKRILAWVIDHERGERFQLSEDEDHMMMVLGVNLGDVREIHGTLMFSRVWTNELQEVAVDHVLTAIVNKRNGDTSEWERLKAMEPDQWIERLETLLVREKQ